MSSSAYTARWPLAARWGIGILGVITTVAALVLGVALLVQYADTGQGGGTVGLVVVGFAPVGLYGIAAARWGAWTPGADFDARVRAIRLASGWALLVGSYLMVYSLPPLRTMTADEWIALARLSVVLAGAIGGVGLVRRHPRHVAYTLLAGAVLSAMLPINVVRIIRGVVVVPLGPAMALSFLTVMSFSLALIAAFLLCWPLRKTGRAP